MKNPVEKNLSLSYEEAAALLEMSLFTYLDGKGSAANNALKKLGKLCRQFSTASGQVDRLPVSQEFSSV